MERIFLCWLEVGVNPIDKKKIWVEKTDGCEYVQCLVCHHELYVSQGEWGRGNSDHDEGNNAFVVQLLALFRTP